jgi:hypothetical protein
MLDLQMLKLLQKKKSNLRVSFGEKVLPEATKNNPIISAKSNDYKKI